VDGFYLVNGGTCVTCPSDYQWSGISCVPGPRSSSRSAYSSSTSQLNQYANTVSVQFR
jgi:hypothetical protein